MPISRLQCKNHTLYFVSKRPKLAKIDNLFMTKTAEKPYPLRLHIPICFFFFCRVY